jgi:enoyl-CoA hydratase/carnithine racemase
MSELLTLKVEAGVALVTLNRPEKLNAVNNALGEAMDRTWVAIHQDPAVRAVVITGAGRAFCAGADMERLSGLAGHRGDDIPGASSTTNPIFEVFGDVPPQMRTRYGALRSLGVPVISAVNGVAMGAGLLLALHCDIRFASPNASFAAGFTRRGLVGELGLPWLLASIVGTGVATEMMLSGRRVDAEEALRVNLVSRLFPAEELMPQVMDYARDLAANTSPTSVRVIKRQMQDVGHQTYCESFAASVPLMREALAREDFKEGLAAFYEKRPPRFTGR